VNAPRPEAEGRPQSTSSVTPFPCMCDLEQAVAILDQIADEALNGDSECLRILPAAVEHFIDIQIRVRERRR
jgi:hypothetical protein